MPCWKPASEEEEREEEEREEEEREEEEGRREQVEGKGGERGGRKPEYQKAGRRFLEVPGCATGYRVEECGVERRVGKRVEIRAGGCDNGKPLISRLVSWCLCGRHYHSGRVGRSDAE